MTTSPATDAELCAQADARETDPADEWMYARGATPRELVALRLRGERDVIVEYQIADVADFTCDDCTDAARCTLVFDPYNTGGDCLASK